MKLLLSCDEYNILYIFFKVIIINKYIELIFSPIIIREDEYILIFLNKLILLCVTNYHGL